MDSDGQADKRDHVNFRWVSGLSIPTARHPLLRGGAVVTVALFLMITDLPIGSNISG
jgi:hypothetical protein